MAGGGGLVPSMRLPEMLHRPFHIVGIRMVCHVGPARAARVGPVYWAKEAAVA